MVALASKLNLHLSHLDKILYDSSADLVGGMIRNPGMFHEGKIPIWGAKSVHTSYTTMDTFSTLTVSTFPVGVRSKSFCRGLTYILAWPATLFK